MEVSMQWITMIGAVIAAVVGFTNLWLSYFDRRDAIRVRYGTHTPIATQAAALYVVNTGKHSVDISDFGFIEADGKLFSIPWRTQYSDMYDAHDPDHFQIGTTNIDPHDLFCTGITFKPEVIGVYAITTTQNIRRVSMTRSRLRPTVFLRYFHAKFLANSP